MELNEFYASIVQEALAAFESGSYSSHEEAFTSIFAEYITELGNDVYANIELCSFRKILANIKISAYAYDLIEMDEDSDAISRNIYLFVTDFTPNPHTPSHIKKTELLFLFRQASNFFRQACKGYKNKLEESSQAYALADIIETAQSEIDELHIIVMTNKIAVNAIPEDRQIGKTIVKYDIWDIERLYQRVARNKSDELNIKIADKYDETMHLQLACSNDIYDCYVGMIPGKLLSQIYSDWGQRLIERNVRSFLQAKNKINRSIRDTIIKEPQMFMAYNNGISTVADSIASEATDTENVIKIKELRGWQIVNGGQTTASLYNAQKSNKAVLDGIYVQMKLTVIKNRDKFDDIVVDISRYANSQNKITMSDFSANDQYHVTLERLSRTTWVPSIKGKATTKWFYERARGQYMVECNRQPTEGKKKDFEKQNPKNQVINKTASAKYQMAWMQLPHIVSRGAETNFVSFMDLVNDNKVPSPDENEYIGLIAKSILFTQCDKIVKSLNLGDYKANVVAYTISLISNKYSDKVDLKFIWENQSLSSELQQLIKHLAPRVWNHITDPVVKGTNITQWCKKEDCWQNLLTRFEKNEI